MEQVIKKFGIMKSKLLIGLLFIVFLLFTSASKPSNLNTWTIYQDGVTYRIFTFEGANGNISPIFVINVTKDKLEIEKLNLEIKKLKSK
jgi:hypothetical protein